MTFTIFASGSTGNAALASSGDVHILLDAGISERRLCQRLGRMGLTAADLTAVLITHPHSDHIAGLNTLARHTSFPIYATPQVARQLCYRMAIDEKVHTIQPNEEFSVQDVTVLPIPTSHDTPGSVGYRLTGPEGKSACLVTDLGVVTDEVRQGVSGVDFAVIECNHDPDCLANGPYPYPLRQRIAGKQGHLSNADGAALAALAAQTAHTVVLAHLSQQNNSPALALAAAREALAPCPPVSLAVAPPLCDGLTWEV